MTAAEMIEVIDWELENANVTCFVKHYMVEQVPQRGKDLPSEWKKGNAMVAKATILTMIRTVVKEREGEVAKLGVDMAKLLGLEKFWVRRCKYVFFSPFSALLQTSLGAVQVSHISNESSWPLLEDSNQQGYAYSKHIAYLML